MGRRLRGCSNSYEFYKEVLDDLTDIHEDSDRQGNAERQYDSSYTPRRRKLTGFLPTCSEQAIEPDKEHAGSFYHTDTSYSKNLHRNLHCSKEHISHYSDFQRQPDSSKNESYIVFQRYSSPLRIIKFPRTKSATT